MIPESVPPAPAIDTAITYDTLAPEDVIGSGGNAIVRRAVVSGTSPPVPIALKEPYLRDAAPTDLVDRFGTEADTWHRLDDHDHIVDVYAWDTEPHPWIALEYMDAGSLHDRLTETDLTPAHALWIGTTLADAIHHAHRHGVAHLDLKPANILFRAVDADDAWAVPKITDWGLARLLIEHSTSLEGLTPQYAAPEQFDPDTFGRADDRTDIYQLGVVLYELLVGQRPFTGRGKHLMQAVLTEAPLPPTTTTDLPAGVDAVLGQALAKRKHDRYETVVDLRRDLELLSTTLLDGEEPQPAQLVADPATTRQGQAGPAGETRPTVPATGYAAAIDLEDEGFVALGPGYFERHDPAPDRGWRTGFQLADVHAGIPADRDGHDTGTASQELFDRLRAGDTQLVVGRAGAGKSTLCKQVAVRWDDDSETGPVYYRESGRGRPFESTASLDATIARADGHVLVVVEDAVRSDAEAILDLVEAHDHDHDATEVSFLLDAREEDLDTFERRTAASAVQRRRTDIVRSLARYRLPPLSEADVRRVVDAFEAATGREVGRTAAALHEEVRTEADLGGMLLLMYLLPVGGDETATTGLEAHVARRYRSLLTPEQADADEKAVRTLSRFDADLVADVGVMVNLLNASGIGVYPELVHALGHAHGHDVQTHDAIAAILAALDGWVLFSADERTEGDGDRWTTHELWSTLFLRELAREHETRQANDRRRPRSEPRTGRCLAALFAIVDDEEDRAALQEEFPESPVLADIEAAPAETAVEYVEAVFDLAERWPVLAPLVGTTATARYALPATLPAAERHQAVLARGNAHSDYASADEARAEYELALDQAQTADDREGEAESLNNLGTVAEQQGAYDEAREYHQRSLELRRDLGDRHGEAVSLNNLGVVARQQEAFDEAREYHQRSLELRRDLGDHHGEAESLNNLGSVASGLGAYDEAREYFQRSLELRRDLGDRHGEAESLHNLGSVAKDQEAYDEAYDYLQRSLAVWEELGDRRGAAASLNNLGGLARAREAYDEAHDYIKRSLAIYEELGDRYGEAASLGNLGMVARERDDLAAAQDYLDRSLAIAHDLGVRQWKAESLCALGMVAEDRGQAARAREQYETARSLFEELGAVVNEFETLINLIELAHDTGRTEAAHEFCETARHRLEAVDDPPAAVREDLAALCETIERE